MEAARRESIGHTAQGATTWRRRIKESTARQAGACRKRREGLQGEGEMDSRKNGSSSSDCCYGVATPRPSPPAKITHHATLLHQSLTITRPPCYYGRLRGHAHYILGATQTPCHRSAPPLGILPRGLLDHSKTPTILRCSTSTRSLAITKCAEDLITSSNLPTKRQSPNRQALALPLPQALSTEQKTRHN